MRKVMLTKTCLMLGLGYAILAIPILVLLYSKTKSKLASKSSNPDSPDNYTAQIMMHTKITPPSQRFNLAEDCKVFTMEIIADGICDDQTNNRDCEFDGGDCCLQNALIEFCHFCVCHKSPRECPFEISLINDGICQYAMYNALCQFDGNDCAMTTREQEEMCTFPCLYFVGDEVCDDSCNFNVCQFDMGDCCNKAADFSFCEDCQCLVELPPCPGLALVHDNVCNEGNLTPECFFDGGDCD